MQEREPGAGPPEEPPATFRVGASRVRDEFGPAIAVARDGAHGPQLHRGIAPVQPIDQGAPGDVEPQILGLVNDPRAILEADNADRAAAIVRIGKTALDRGDPAGGAGDENIAADRREVGVEPEDEFARRFDPLPREGGDEPQQDRLVFEQTPEPAAFHFGDELIVARCRGRGGLRRPCRSGRHGCGLSRLVEALVERRRRERGQFVEQRTAQAGAGGFGQVAQCARIDVRAKPRLGFEHDRRQQVFERARFGSVVRGGLLGVFASALQCCVYPDRVGDPWRRRGRRLATNAGEPGERLREGQPVAHQPPFKQRPVAAGA